MSLLDDVESLDAQGLSFAEIAKRTGASIPRVKELLKDPAKLPTGKPQAQPRPSLGGARVLRRTEDDRLVFAGRVALTRKKALLLALDGERQLRWCPKSLCSVHGSEIHVAAWFAVKEWGVTRPADLSQIAGDLLA